MSILTKLITQIDGKNSTVAIVGLGYVGLPLMLRFVEAGFKTIGFDIDHSKVYRLNNGESYIETISNHRIEGALSAGFRAETDFARIEEADALILCVPTPLNKFREPDLSHVLSTISNLLPFIRHGQIVSLESTTYPGTTDEELLPRIESTGLRVGEDIFLVYSPEREDPGNPRYSTRTIPKVVGGVTSSCLAAGCALYRAVIDSVVEVSSVKVAEITKLLENIHRSVNIGLVNEMKIVCDRMGIDIHEVIRAAATKPFGFVPYYPGPGLGGHCIPVDPFYLTWKAREFGVHTRFIELAGEINRAMPAWVVGKIIDAMNDRGKSLMHSRMLVLGVAYKRDVDDTRESPSLEIMEILRSKGVSLSYADPHIPTLPKMSTHDCTLSSIELTPEAIASFDCVVIATDHTKFNYQMIKAYSNLIVDSRGVYKEHSDNVVKA